MLKEKRNLSGIYKAVFVAALILALGLMSACGAPAAGESKGSESGGSSVVQSGAGEQSPSKEVSEERAKELALSHAKVESVDFVKVELDYDNGRKKWELEFYKDGYEYDYEINAESGEIISFSKEKEHDRIESGQEVKPEGGEQSSQQISEEQAKVKALEHAGVSASEAVFSKVELDLDERRPHYEVEFRVGRYEYDCSVDLESGQVFDFEKDFDD